MTLPTRALTAAILLGAVVTASCGDNPMSPVSGSAVRDFVEDVQSPSLVSLAFAPAAINTTTAEAAVEVTARITDDVAGSADELLLYFYGPGDLQFVYGFLRRVDGTPLDGTYTATVTFPRFSQAGEWRLGFIALKDLASNQHFISTEEIKALGFNTRLDVTSIEDITAPTLASVTFAPTSINTSEADAQVQVTARITDDVSGSGDELLLYFYSPGDLQFVYGFLRRTAGTTLDGTYTATLTFPRYSQGGEWRLGFIVLKDLANNQHFISTDEIRALGFNTALRVVGETVSPAQAIQNLLGTIKTMALPRGVANSLSAPLQNVDTANRSAACGKVGAFINQVRAKLDSGQLTASQANELAAAARSIEEGLGCGG